MDRAHELARLWSQLAHARLDMQGFVSHLHDAGLSALAAAIVMLGVVILMELRSVGRMRQVMDRSLERVFEQLDLLRFETQQLEERWESPETGNRRNAEAGYAVRALPQSAPVGVSELSAAPPAAASAAVTGRPGLPDIPVLHATPMAETAAGAVGRELAGRRNLPSGEARLLSSLAEARARRGATAGGARG